MSAPADRSRRPAGIREGGQFATEARAEAAVALSAGRDILPSETQSVEALTTHYLHIAQEPTARSMAQAAVDDACAAAGDGVPREWVAAVVAHDAPVNNARGGTLGGWGYSAPVVGETLRDAYAAGMPADWAARVREERGPAWVHGCVRRYAEGLTAEELARLDKADLAHTPAKAMAYVECDADEVHRWHTAAKQDPALSAYLERYLSHQGVGRYVREGVPLEDVRLCHALDAEPGLASRGLTRPDGTVEKGPVAIRELVEYARACGQSTDEAYEGIRAGVTAATVKAFGPKVAVTEIPAFEGAGVPAKVVRSLRARDGRISPTEVAQLHEAGISTGADYKGWMAVADTVRGVDDSEYGGYTAALDLARSGVPLPVAKAMREQQVPLRSIRELHEAGIADIEPWAKSLHGQTQVTATWSNRMTTGLHYVAEFAKAGGTPEQLRRAQRAGVPLAQSASHVDSTPEQLWEAGAHNRAAYRRDTQRLRRTYGDLAAEPTPWDVPGPGDL